jgi:hypothetical protein
MADLFPFGPTNSQENHFYHQFVSQAAIDALKALFAAQSIKRSSIPTADLKRRDCEVSSSLAESFYLACLRLGHLCGPELTEPDVLSFSQRFIRVALSIEFSMFRMVPDIVYVVIKENREPTLWFEDVEVFYDNDKPALVSFRPKLFPKSARVVCPVGMLYGWCIGSVIHASRVASANRIMMVSNPPEIDPTTFAMLYLEWAESIQRTYDGDAIVMFDSAVAYLEASGQSMTNDISTWNQTLYRTLLGIVREACLTQSVRHRLPSTLVCVAQAARDYPEKFADLWPWSQTPQDVLDITMDFAFASLGQDIAFPEQLQNLVSQIVKAYKPLRLCFL